MGVSVCSHLIAELFAVAAPRMNEIEKWVNNGYNIIFDAEKKLGRSSAKNYCIPSAKNRKKFRNSPTHSREAGFLIVDKTLEDLPGMQINRATAEEKVGSVYGFQDPA